MPGSIKDVLKCWNRDGNEAKKEERWKMVPECIGGLFGQKGTRDVLRTNNAIFRRSRRTA